MEAPSIPSLAAEQRDKGWRKLGDVAFRQAGGLDAGTGYERESVRRVPGHSPEGERPHDPNIGMLERIDPVDPFDDQVGVRAIAGPSGPRRAAARRRRRPRAPSAGHGRPGASARPVANPLVVTGPTSPAPLASGEVDADPSVAVCGERERLASAATHPDNR